MNKALSIGLVVCGIVLLIFGFQALNSLSSEISRVFTGTPSGKAMRLLGAGAGATFLGLVGWFASRGR